MSTRQRKSSMSNRRTRDDRGKSINCGLATDSAMAVDFLVALKPPLKDETIEVLRRKLPEHNLSLSTLSALKTKELGTLLGMEQSIAELARIKASIPSEPAERYAPPPLGPNGEPVIVRPKIGFTALSQVDMGGY